MTEKNIRVRYKTDFGFLETSVVIDEAVEAFFELHRISNMIAIAKRLKSGEVCWHTTRSGELNLDSLVSSVPKRVALGLARSFPARITKEVLSEITSVHLDKVRKLIPHRDYKHYFDETESGIRLSSTGTEWAYGVIQEFQEKYGKQKHKQ